MHNRYQTGKYSKYAPARLVERAQAALDDPELLSLREEIALLEARIQDVLSKCETRDSNARWKELETAYLDLEAIHTGARNIKPEDHARELKAALLRIKALVRSGSEERANWAEISNLIEQRRRLVESEQKRLERMNQFITTSEALGIITQVLESVKRHVPSAQVRKLIGQDCARFLESTKVGGKSA